MNWILYSAVMFVGSIVYYLLVKKVQKLGVEKNLYMLINSIVPIFLFLALSLLNTGTLQLSFKGYLIAIFTAMILNYIGSVAGFMGIKKAPNSGYSVIIQKSYAAYTTFLSILLFNSEFIPYKIIGVILILLFTGLIIVEKNKGKFYIGKWVLYSFIAFFLFGFTTITARYIKIIGDDANTYMFWTMLLTMLTSIFPFIKQYRKTKPEIKGNTIMWLFLMSSAVSVFYWGKNMSTITAPNVGYTGAINASSNAILTILSAFIFKEELKPIKFLYVIGVVIGIIILII